MNYKAIVYYIGMVLKLCIVFMFAPSAIAFYDGDMDVVRSFGFSAVVIAVIVLILEIIYRIQYMQDKRQRGLYAKDSFVVVAVCWLCISFFGALPYYFSGYIPSFIDCLFESVSGFSTTGASILTNVEHLPRGLLFWRNFTIWIGGMGVLVFLLATSRTEHSVYLMRAESTGPQPGKLVPRLRQSSLILYEIYISMTIVQIIVLLIAGMPLFDSICSSLSTAGTGGFYIKNASIAFYDNLTYEMIIAFFMVFFGINFNMLYFLLIRNFRAVWKSEEFRVYIGIVLASALVIGANLTLCKIYPTFAQSLRYSIFQVGSIITSTGFSTANFTLWPEMSRMLLMVLMIIGASSGSTCGGLKVARLIIILKETRALLFRMAHPRSVSIVKLDGKAVDSYVVSKVNSHFILLALIMAVSILLLTVDNRDFETTLSAVVSCTSNIGPGLGKVGPMGNYSDFSVFSKLVLCMDMLIGRLEIYPILLLFSPNTWRRI